MDDDRQQRLRARRAALQDQLRRDAQRQRIGHWLAPLAAAGVACQVVHDLDPLFAWLAASFPAGRPAVDWSRVPHRRGPGHGRGNDDDERRWLAALAADHPGPVTLFRDGGDPGLRLAFADWVDALHALRTGGELWVAPDDRAWLLEWQAGEGWTFAPTPAAVPPAAPA